jgi:hypothetical protein
MKEVYVSKEKGRGIKKIVALEPYLVTYEDSSGTMQRRIVFRSPKETLDPANPEDTGVYVLQERMSGTYVTTVSNPWFADSMNEILSPSKPKGRRAPAASSV